jgi:hypothetical protein
VNPEIKAEWQRRLRSGEYKQGRGALYRQETDEYCCLGVLCRIAEEASIVTTKVYTFDDGEQSDNITFVPTDGSESNAAVLPNAVADWAGLLDTNPDVRIKVKFEMERWSIATVNDSKLVDFSGIADLVDQL